MEQMSLMALADTIATTSTDLKDSQGKSKGTAGKVRFRTKALPIYFQQSELSFTY